MRPGRREELTDSLIARVGEETSHRLNSIFFSMGASRAAHGRLYEVQGHLSRAILVDMEEDFGQVVSSGR